ncbi:MAG: ABC transporter ATP-binding protein [Thermaerobacter sp.]
MARLETDRLTLAYGAGPSIIEDLDVRIPEGAVTAIIGPNGCGKSTLLRALARLLAPRGGAALLDGQAIHRLPTRVVAQRLGLLPQQAFAPEAITVEDLVRRGRYPHQGYFRPYSRDDEAAVNRALELAGMVELRHRPVDQLSGGQRQRAWIAMVLAQETPVLLLDEPTTYLDVAHQEEVLALVRRLNREEGRTVVAVLHDVNQAARISDFVIALRDGRVAAQGRPEEVLRPEHLERVFSVGCDLLRLPQGGAPWMLPRSRLLDPNLAAPGGGPALRAEGLSAGYDGTAVVRDVSCSPPPGRITAIVGPNGCGKSTLLKALARLLRPWTGTVLLDGRPVHVGRHRDLARRLAVLSQEGAVPADLRVEDVVALGRRPHQTWYRTWSREDEEAVERAMSAVGILDLRGRSMDALSGGQRQRVWLAMALAQDTPVLLLDEPTTFLDIAHQVEVLDLIWHLNRSEGRTVIMVLHDLCLACRYADHIIAMRDGRVVAEGEPGRVIDAGLMQQVFGVPCCTLADPVRGTPVCIPLDAAGTGGS